MDMINPIWYVTSNVIATGRKYRLANGGKLILFKHILLSSILLNNRVIVIKSKQKNFQLQLSTFENLQLQLQQNRVISYNFVNYNYKFSKPVGSHRAVSRAELFGSGSGSGLKLTKFWA